jgi:hypothetical protein
MADNQLSPNQISQLFGGLAGGAGAIGGGISDLFAASVDKSKAQGDLGGPGGPQLGGLVGMTPGEGGGFLGGFGGPVDRAAGAGEVRHATTG